MRYRGQRLPPGTVPCHEQRGFPLCGRSCGTRQHAVHHPLLIHLRNGTCFPQKGSRARKRGGVAGCLPAGPPQALSYNAGPRPYYPFTTVFGFLADLLPTTTDLAPQGPHAGGGGGGGSQVLPARGRAGQQRQWGAGRRWRRRARQRSSQRQRGEAGPGGWGGRACGREGVAAGGRLERDDSLPVCLRPCMHQTRAWVPGGGDSTRWARGAFRGLVHAKRPWPSVDHSTHHALPNIMGRWKWVPLARR